MEIFRHDGMTFDVLDGGPRDGPAVVLLHGFPQDATSWSAVSERLHAAGLRTLAPHQRGYSAGARPRGASAYTADRLVGDVVALLDQAEVEQATVAGHDWGAGVAWALAQAHPDRVSGLVPLSVPHPAALLWSLRHGTQALRSWYMLFFQVPHLPEHLLAQVISRGGLERQGVPAAHSRRYAARLDSADALRGPVNWYRGILRPGGRSLGDAPVNVPTTFVWGNRDPVLTRAGAERTAHYVTADYRFVEVDAGHWLPERKPDVVAEEILARSGAGGP